MLISSARPCLLFLCEYVLSCACFLAEREYVIIDAPMIEATAEELGVQEQMDVGPAEQVDVHLAEQVPVEGRVLHDERLVTNLLLNL